MFPLSHHTPRLGGCRQIDVRDFPALVEQEPFQTILTVQQGRSWHLVPKLPTEGSHILMGVRGEKDDAKLGLGQGARLKRGVLNHSSQVRLSHLQTSRSFLGCDACSQFLPRRRRLGLWSRHRRRLGFGFGFGFGWHCH